ncbi:CASP-like protein 2C1 [Citrus sinensis]|uniref:CASP-like protein 2C1 n=1 Tax=Citrus sinensis TaxID=2711 RepID=A0ACB8P7L7_CITSI|nr:CASP-like protein 2C1 [Citrus sinensis]
MDVQKIEAFVRVWAALLLLLTACLVGLDTQSKYIFYVDRKITYKELHALGALVYVASAAAGYNLLQLGRSVFVSRYLGNSKGSYRYLAWVSYLLDQMVVYIAFGTNSAAVEHSVLALSGMKEFQWMKWCNKFTRFCFQIGGALYLVSFAIIQLIPVQSTGSGLRSL